MNRFPSVLLAGLLATVSIPVATAGVASDECHGLISRFDPEPEQLHEYCDVIGETEPEGLEGTVLGIVGIVLGYGEVVRDCLEDWNPIGDPFEPLRCPL